MERDLAGKTEELGDTHPSTTLPTTNHALGRVCNIQSFRWREIKYYDALHHVIYSTALLQTLLHPKVFLGTSCPRSLVHLIIL
jgi:hypothetical protein